MHVQGNKTIDTEQTNTLLTSTIHNTHEQTTSQNTTPPSNDTNDITSKKQINDHLPRSINTQNRFNVIQQQEEEHEKSNKEQTKESPKKPQRKKASTRNRSKTKDPEQPPQRCSDCNMEYYTNYFKLEHEQYWHKNEPWEDDEYYRFERKKKDHVQYVLLRKTR